MSYGILVQRLKKEEERVARSARLRLVKATPIRAGQTPTDIVLAALHDLPRRPRRRVA